ncbi:MAG: NINE protein [Caldisericia bacterium]|nr:NINE protein [Caldisericia bacterium]
MAIYQYNLQIRGFMDLDTESMLKYQDLSDADKRAFVARYEVEKKKPWVFYLLLILIGGLGIHKFYVRQNGLGIIYIATIVLSWFGEPGFVIFSLVRFGLEIYDLLTGVSQVRKCNQEYFKGILDEMTPEQKTTFVQLNDVDDDNDNDSSDDDIPNTGLM